MQPYCSMDGITLYLGDCIEVTAWLAADVLVTDPPYGIGYQSGWYDGPTRPIHGDGDAVARDTALGLWGPAPAVVFGSWRTPRPADTGALLVWDKGASPGMGALNIPWGPSHEEIYILGRWPPITPGGRVREGGTPARSVSVLRYPTLNSQAHDRPEHPTPKPVPLMETLIAKCPPGVVADPFAGSGSTLIAARNLGRAAIGVEIEERYCELTARRLSQGVLFAGDDG
jgi:site-specific DNA-methyltransferase (adenine-specific)